MAAEATTKNEYHTTETKKKKQKKEAARGFSLIAGIKQYHTNQFSQPQNGYVCKVFFLCLQLCPCLFGLAVIFHSAGCSHDSQPDMISSKENERKEKREKKWPAYQNNMIPGINLLYV